MPKLRFIWDHVDKAKAFMEIYTEYIASRTWLADLDYIPPGVVIDVANGELAEEIKTKAEKLGLQVQLLQ